MCEWIRAPPTPVDAATQVIDEGRSHSKLNRDPVALAAGSLQPFVCECVCVVPGNARKITRPLPRSIFTLALSGKSTGSTRVSGLRYTPRRTLGKRKLFVGLDIFEISLFAVAVGNCHLN